jgi:hypothetical protein
VTSRRGVLVGTVDSELRTIYERAIYEEAEYDLRRVLIRLSGPFVDDVSGIREMRELIQEADTIVESLLLDRRAYQVGKESRKTA